MLTRLATLLALSTILSACAADAQSADDESGVVDDTAPLSAGVNGGACLVSSYNCKLRDVGGNRVLDSAGSESWAVSAANVLDSKGDLLAAEPAGSLKFNYGQARVLDGKLHLLAMSTASGSAGWFPLDSITQHSEIDGIVGRVFGQDPGEGPMACYEVSNAEPDAALVLKKVVKNATGTNERAGDYLPLTRNNGKRYANLAFNVPGMALGGPSIDILEAGTKFQRVRVPTKSGSPHLSVQLYVADTDGAFTKKSGTFTFYYGYVVGGGEKHFGWMAADALDASSDCP